MMRLDIKEQFRQITFEPYEPTIARMVPLKIKRRNSFSATNDEKARLHQTEPPNALPASWRCPSQPSAWWEVLSLSMRNSLSVMTATIPAMSLISTHVPRCWQLPKCYSIKVTGQAFFWKRNQDSKFGIICFSAASSS
jgi:hypothetical protein